MITTVIFDMDDTLYDEIDYCSSGFRAVAKFLAAEHGVDAGAAFDALWSEFCSGNHDRTFNAALELLKIPCKTEDIVGLVRLYRGHKPDIKLPVKEKQCVETKDYMRKKHMQLLDLWRDSVVRVAQRSYVAPNGTKYDMSLQNTSTRTWP